MKNILKRFTLFMLATSLLVAGCSEDKQGIYDVDNGLTAYLFNSSTTALAITQTGVSTAKIVVGVTTRSETVRRIPIKIDPASTAMPAEYTINDATLVIPAGGFIGTIEITGNFNAIPTNVTKTLILRLDEATGIDILDNKGVHTLSLSKFCPTALVGNYSVTTTYQSHDFLPNYASNTMTAAVAAATGANTYKVLDFSGGLYSTGPYATTTIGGYQTGIAADAALRDLTFTVNCGQISWANERDKWGPIIPTPGAVNAFNATTGSFTISWTAERYGEKGISVYTRLP